MTKKKKEPKTYPQDEAFVVSLDDPNRLIPVTELTHEEWSAYQKKMMENAGRAMSRYYSGVVARGEAEIILI